MTIFRNVYGSSILAKITKNPFLLALVLMLFHFLSSYPGGMTSDSFDQFNQSLTFNFSSHHPPLMSILWAFMNYIYTGPQIMLILHLCLLWASVLFLYYADPVNKYRWLYFILPFLPNILAQSTMIWKDISFGNSFFFVFSGCTYYLYQEKKPSIYIVFVFVLVGYYSLSVKFQAKFIIFPLFFFLSTLLKGKTLLFKLVCALIFSASAIILNSLIISKFSVNTNSWQLRQFFDIAGIITAIDDDSALPSYIKNSEIYNFNILKKKFTHKSVDSLIFSEDRVYRTVQDVEELECLNKTFIKLVSLHPLLYLKHRILNFCFLMISCYSSENYSAISNTNNLKNVEIALFKDNLLKIFLINYLKLYPNIFRTNLVSSILIWIYLITFLKTSKVSSKEKVILGYVIAVGIIFSGVQLFTNMASDYRYYYIIRLLTFFTVPIYLKLRLLNKLEAKR